MPSIINPGHNTTTHSSKTHPNSIKMKKNEKRRYLIKKTAEIFITVLTLTALLVFTYIWFASDNPRALKKFQYALDWKSSFEINGGNKITIVNDTPPGPSLFLEITPTNVSPLGESDRLDEYARCIVASFRGIGRYNQSPLSIRGECLLNVSLTHPPLTVVLNRSRADRLDFFPNSLSESAKNYITKQIKSAIRNTWIIKIPLISLTPQEQEKIYTDKIDLHKEGPILYLREE